MRERRILPLGRMDAEVSVPPSKSVTNRALVIAALAKGRTTLLNPLEAADTRLMAGALETLGVEVQRAGGAWQVQGCGGRLPSGGASLTAGDAGTAMRFLTALVATGNGSFLVDGSERMRQRPIAPLVEALRDLGCRVNYQGEEGFPPVRVEASGLRGGEVRLAGEVSSQFLSALLMVAPCGREGLRVEVSGGLVSAPYVDLTVSVMEDFGVPVERGGGQAFRVRPGVGYSAREYHIEGDFSSASYFFAAAAVTGGRVRVRNLRRNSQQGDRKFLDILARMGCRFTWGGEWVELSGGRLRGVAENLRDMPDMAQTLGVVALFAEGRTVLRGLANLRIKETDRLAALASELGKLGALVRVGRDHLEIEPRTLSGAEIDTYGDHRMAMSFSVAGLRIPGVTIRDPDCVAKSYPGFWKDFERLYA